MADSSVTWDLVAKDRASQTLGRIGDNTDRLRERVHHTAKALALLAGGGAIAGVTAALRTGFSEVSSYQKGLAQLHAGLKSTHGAAGVTAKQMEKLASRIESYSGQTDDSIVATEQLLLTFTNIHDAAGKNNDIFTQTTKIAADMAARLGGDASSSAIQLGKALNDPVKGITALTRVGVSFDDQQKKQIATAVEHGHVLRAQKIELQELNREFGGSARLYGHTLPGQIDRTKRAWEGISQQLVEKLTPDLLDLAKFTRKEVIPALEDFAGWVKDHKREIEWFGGALAGMAISVKALKGVRSLQTLVGKGPLSPGGFVGKGAIGAPVHVWVDNWTGKVPTGKDPVPTPTGKTSRLGALKRILPGPLIYAEAYFATSGGDVAPGQFHQKSRPLTTSLQNILDPSGKGDFPMSVYHGGTNFDPRLATQFLEDHGSGKQLAQLKALGRTYPVVAHELKQYAKDQQALNQLLVVNPGLAKNAAAANEIIRRSLNRMGAGAKAAGHGIGTDLGAGLIAGLEAEIPHATASGQQAVLNIAKGMRVAADIHSPSKVTDEIGHQLAQGLVNGWMNSKVFDHLSHDVQHGLDRLYNDVQRARDYRRGVFENLVSVDLTSVSENTDLLGGSGPGKVDVLGTLRKQAKSVEAFDRLERRLRHRHLNRHLLEQFEQEGTAALPAMRELLHSGAAGIRQANRLERRILAAGHDAADKATINRFSSQMHSDLVHLPPAIGRAMRKELKHLHINVDLKELDRKQGQAVRHHS